MNAYKRLEAQQRGPSEFNPRYSEDYKIDSEVGELLTLF